jgi:transcriptional regulator with XRE-family HTH domain
MKSDSTYLVELGKRLRSARKSCGMSQKDFSEKLGVRQPNVCSYEYGKNSLTVQQLIRVCEITGVSADWLLGLSGKKRHDDISLLSLFTTLFFYIKKGIGVKKDSAGTISLVMDDYSSAAEGFMDVVADLERYCSGGAKGLSPEMLSEFEASWLSKMNEKYDKEKDR